MSQWNSVTYTPSGLLSHGRGDEKSVTGETATLERTDPAGERRVRKDGAQSLHSLAKPDELESQWECLPISPDIVPPPKSPLPARPDFPPWDP